MSQRNPGTKVSPVVSSQVHPLSHDTHSRTHLFFSRVGVEVVSEDSDGSDRAPSRGETPFSSYDETGLAWSLFRVTGDPDTSHHFLDGRWRDDGDGRCDVECGSTSSCGRGVGARV
jgi:hypothetical protein